jgi:hypothetical protein
MTDSTVIVLGATSLALAVVLYVWFALALAAMFRKMGEPDWKAWVPVLNVATVLRRGDFSPWLVLLNVVPLFGAIAFAVVFIVAVHRITTAFGGGAGLTVVGALFPIVWASILGWGSARWSSDEDSARLDERSGPFRRGADHAPAYTPLIGGWTPDAADAPDVPTARSRWTPDAENALPAPSLGRGGWIPDAAGRTDPPDSGRDDASAPASAPVMQPFAAPSGSLADAVPSPADWAPPAAPEPFSFEPRRRSDDDVSPVRADAVPDSAVSEVLDALRDDSRVGSSGRRRGLGVDALHGLSSPPAEAATSEKADAPADRATAGVGVGAWGEDERREPRPAERPQDGHEPDPDEEPAVAPWSAPSRRAHRAGVDGPGPIADVPLTRPSPETAAIARPTAVVPGEEFPELSEAVSAVSEVPEAGSPRSARTSVSSLYEQSAVPDTSEDDVDALDRTVVTRRKRIPWMLVPPSGAPVDLTSDVVILGRRPGPDAAHPDAQLVAIVDETRTVSKTHARLHLRGETWYVTDLDSTNGVLFATLMGTEVEAPRGEEIEAGARFFLGDAEVRLARSDA